MNKPDMSLIKRLLQKSTLCRIDDCVLYAEYVRNDSENTLTSEQKAIFCDILENHLVYKLPNFKTVVRERAMIQATLPELKERRTAENRKRAEEDYRKEYRR